MASSSKSETPVHLVVLCHGLWGEPKHLHTLETLLCRSLGSRASITKGTGGKSRKDQQVGPNDVESMNGSTSTLNTASDSIEDDDSKLDGYLREYVNQRKEEDQDMDVLILNSMSSAGARTYDGIDWIAERVVREIRAEEKELKGHSKYIARFSIVGYSLGGLVARYVIALLDSQSFFTKNPAGNGGSVVARHFATFATPHIGVPPANGIFGRLANFIGGRLLSRTGEQLYLRDSGWESDDELHQHKQQSSTNLKVGLIESMARPDSIFIRALNRFEKITIYANAVNDMTVPFRTGCIEEWDPFYERKGELNVSLMSGTPLLSTVEPGEAPVLTRWEKIRSMTPTLPFFLNPRRLPMNAPYNYLVVLGLPILLPTMIVLVLYRFSTESRKSRARVSELDKGWTLEEGKGQDERSRIDKLVRSIVMSSTEDQVDEERNMMSPSEESKPANVQVGGKDNNGILDVPATRRSPLQVDIASKKHKQPDLLDSQKKMIRSLNDPAIVPRLEKRWTYFDDVTNSHAIIVCRMPSIEVHRRGLAILKHFVDDFHV